MEKFIRFHLLFQIWEIKEKFIPDDQNYMSVFHITYNRQKINPIKMTCIILRWHEPYLIWTITFQPLVMSEEEAFSLVHEYDQSKCGERLICELATRSRYGLLSDEESLLSLIK